MSTAKRKIVDRDFVKERKAIVRTITKIDSEQKNLVEKQGFDFARSLGYSTPNIYGMPNTALTMDFVKGISAYSGLEVLSQQRRYDEMRDILEQLCDGMQMFHERKDELLIEDFCSYDVDKKIPEIIELMKEDGWKESSQLEMFMKEISYDFKNSAVMPFRDATPKNYILKGVSIDVLENGCDYNFTEKIVYIDFSTVAELTTQNDDFLSILYHYMIPDQIREDLMNKYVPNQGDKGNIVGKFVRLGRFWSRRRYYEKYQSKIFRKRYPYEDMLFYENAFREAVVSVLKFYNRNQT